MLSLSSEYDLRQYDINWISSYAAECIEAVMSQARKDLSKGRGSAYFWIACPRSNLYEYIRTTLDIDLLPGRVAAVDETARAIREGGLPEVPQAGITSLVLDTSNAKFWYGADRGMNARRYAEKLSTCSDSFEYIEGAISNGVDVVVNGAHSKTFRQALRAFIEAHTNRDFATEAAGLKEAHRALLQFAAKRGSAR